MIGKLFNSINVPTHCSGRGGGRVKMSPDTILLSPLIQNNFTATAAVCVCVCVDKSSLVLYSSSLVAIHLDLLIFT